MRWTPLLLVVLVGALGCPAGDRRYDTDEDGSLDDLDCAPADPTIHPGADDPYSDDVDQDCDGWDGVDRDGDGYPANPELSDQPIFDCNDANLHVHPGAVELPNNGRDDDCDGYQLEDRDGDGWSPDAGDCDDEDPSRHPDAVELPDGIDQDCDNQLDEGTEARDDDADGACEGWDTDGDGLAQCSDGATPGDCDDEDPSLNLSDIDGDGRSSCQGDCDDFEPAVNLLADEVCDGVDTDCDGQTPADEVDDDEDGALVCAGDCDDSDPGLHPGVEEVCNGHDDDCDPDSEENTDWDGDGLTLCEGDCDDADTAVFPGVTELCDGADNDCDGVTDEACTDCAITVPLDVGTIQAGLDAAANGDKVCVLPGTYFENIDYGGKAVHLFGVVGPEVTTIDGMGLDSVVVFDDGEGLSAVLEGFTITGGSAEEGGGVRIDGAHPTLRGLVVAGNTATEAGGGVSVVGGGVDLSDTTLASNDGTVLGGGVYLAGSMGLLGELVVGDNSARHGGGMYLYSSSMVLGDSQISGNWAESHGGGVKLGSSSATIERCAIEDNGAGENGGGVQLLGGSSPTFSNVVISGNSAGDAGGGLDIQDSSPSLDHVLISGNTAASGGVHLDGAFPTAVNVLIIGNTSGLSTYMSGPLLSFTSIIDSQGPGLVIQTDTAELFATDVSGGVVGIEHWPGDEALLSTFSNIGGNVTDFGPGVPPPSPDDGNLNVDPDYLVPWYGGGFDAHLSATSPLIDAADPDLLDPDGSPADIGAFGGPGADEWDLDGDGYPWWWQPGPYDFLNYPAEGWDCDDLDATVYPGNGC
jgi:hypothetical protein